MDTYDEIFSPLQRAVCRTSLDRKSGAIDPIVAEYWEDHYDITHLLEERWSVLGPQVAGKLHVFVGAEDTFHLEGSTMLMRAALRKLGSDAEFQIVPGADHWQIFEYQGGLIEYSVGEMIRRLRLQAP